ncbi:MAG: hypothetical protein IPP13_17085 [Kouleothrix sp.]|nr:hypothetical protein [Kouleothrix sp.]
MAKGLASAHGTCVLTLSAPAGARLGMPSAATITITDDDATPPSDSAQHWLRFVAFAASICRTAT